MTFICFDIAKVQCQKLKLLGISFLSLICPCMVCLKENMQGKIKARRIKMLYIWLQACLLGDVGVIGYTSKVIVPSSIYDCVWVKVIFLYLKLSIHVDTDAILRCFSHTTRNILCYFWYMCRYNMIWPSQGIHVLMYTH